jgi:hypothetical protein
MSLAPAGTATYSVHGTVVADASGTVESSAAVFPPAGWQDPNSTDDTATDIDTIPVTDRIFANGFDPP